MEAVRQLHPKLESLCLQAEKQDWLFFRSYDHLSPKLKLESMDPDSIANERLDSQLLLTCFETP